MATLNTVTNLKASVKLDDVWNSASSTKDSTTGLLIMIKQKVAASENVANEDILAVTMDIGLDSGEDAQVLTTNSLTFNFAPIAKVSDCSIDERAAFVKVSNFPNKFYYKFTAIETKNKVYTVKDKIDDAVVEANIKLNINEVLF